MSKALVPPPGQAAQCPRCGTGITMIHFRRRWPRWWLVKMQPCPCHHDLTQSELEQLLAFMQSTQNRE